MLARIYIIKHTLLNYKLCMCCAHFHFLYIYLIFTPNPGLYTPMSLGSPPNGLLFTPSDSSGFAPVSAIMPGHGGGGGGGCYFTNAKFVAQNWGGEGREWYSNGWVWAGVNGSILEQDIYCTIPVLILIPSPDSGFTRKLVLELHGAPRSTTSRPQL